MRLLDDLKAFFWLRRIALAAERQADAQERLVKLFEAEQPHPKPPRAKAEFSLVDQEQINKDWERRMAAERDGIELDD